MKMRDATSGGKFVDKGIMAFVEPSSEMPTSAL